MKSTNTKELKEAFENWRLFCEAKPVKPPPLPDAALNPTTAIPKVTRTDIPNLGDTLHDIPNLYEFMNDMRGGDVDTLVDAIPVVDSPRIPQADVFFSTPNGIWRLRFDKAGETIIDIVDNAAVLPDGLMNPAEAADHLRGLPGFDASKYDNVLRSLDDLADVAVGLQEVANLDELGDVAGRAQGSGLTNLGPRMMYHIDQFGQRVKDAYNGIVGFWSPERKDARTLQQLAKWKQKMFNYAFESAGSRAWGRVDPKTVGDKWDVKRARMTVGLDPKRGKTANLSDLQVKINPDKITQVTDNWLAAAKTAGDTGANLEAKANELDATGVGRSKDPRPAGKGSSNLGGTFDRPGAVGRQSALDPRRTMYAGKTAEELRKEAAILKDKAAFLEDLVKDIRRLNAAAPRSYKAMEFVGAAIKRAAHMGRKIGNKAPGWVKWVFAGLSAVAIYNVMDEIRMYLGAMGEGTLLAFATLVEEDPTGYLAEYSMIFFEEKAREVRDKLRLDPETGRRGRPEDLSGLDAIILQSLNRYEADQREGDEDRQADLSQQYGRLSGTGGSPNVPAGTGKMEESLVPGSIKIILG